MLHLTVRSSLICLSACCSTVSAEDKISVEPASEIASKALQKLLDDSWEFRMRSSPVWATRVGDHRWNNQLGRYKVNDYLARLRSNRAFLKRLDAIDRAALSRTDQNNFDIFRRGLADAIGESEFDSYQMPITNRWGFHISFPSLRNEVPLKTVADYENYIARLREFKRVTNEHIELMRLGIKNELTLPAIVLAAYRKPIESHIVDDPVKSLLYEPLGNMPPSFSDQSRKQLIETAKSAIDSSVVPAYREFLKFMEKEYVPACRTSVGASALPRGREYYRFLVKKFTTLDLTPEQVHETGHAEVKRIHAEMDEIIKQVEFDGDFEAFVKFLRTDPRFYPKTAKELMKETAYVAKRMDAALPKLFGRLPRTPFGLREVPSYIAPQTTSAYYKRPAGDGTAPGYYFVNTYNLKSRPLYSVEALTLHEAAPGHHLQIALQQEISDLPLFRRFDGFTAFIEGWALYAERLGLEVGFYKDPYSDFGRLNYEMWRACRLVVDSGMHYFGWTRKQAIEFMAKNTALSMHNITSEVDRYISWPGQALAYKTGELKIRELRKFAESQLLDGFDVRRFHDTVLGSGSVPLNVLEQNIRAFVVDEFVRLNRITLTIDKEGRVDFLGVQYELADLAQELAKFGKELKSAGKSKPKTVVTILAHRDTPVGLAQQAMQACIKSNIMSIRLRAIDP
jgi:uncharacterized protein (DUF885 family)